MHGDELVDAVANLGLRTHIETICNRSGKVNVTENIVLELLQC